MRALLPLLIAATAAGCASDAALRRAQASDLYRQHAGEPVPHFSAVARVDTWTPLGNDTLVVWTTPSRAYLLTVSPCPDLDFANGIALTESAGRVSARFDKVTPLTPHGSRIPCYIEEIRPIDVKAYRDARKAGATAP